MYQYSEQLGEARAQRTIGGVALSWHPFGGFCLDGVWDDTAGGPCGSTKGEGNGRRLIIEPTRVTARVVLMHSFVLTGPNPVSNCMHRPPHMAIFCIQPDYADYRILLVAVAVPVTAP